MKCLGRKIFAPHYRANGGSERARFFGDKFRYINIMNSAGKNADVKIFALPVERGACQGIPVFPAVQTADRESIYRMNAQTVAVAVSPDETFFICRHELSLN